jgi:phosphatidate cytidylyltransferase
MALHLQTFKIRTLTSIVFVIVMLSGLLINHWTFFLLFSIIHFGCFYEYFQLAGKIESEYRHISIIHRMCVMLAGWGFMLYMTNNAYSIGEITLSEIGWHLMLVMLIVLPGKRNDEASISNAFHLLG